MPYDFAAQLAARWVEATEQLERQIQQSEHDIDRLTAQRDEASKGLDLIRAAHAENDAELIELRQEAAQLRYKNANQVGMITDARRQRDEADVRCAALEAERDQLRRERDEAQTAVRELRAERMRDLNAVGLTAEQIEAGMAAEGRSYTVSSPYLTGPWRVMMTWCPGGPHAGSPVADHDHIRLTPMFGPDPEGWTIEAPIAPLKLDRYGF